MRRGGQGEETLVQRLLANNYVKMILSGVIGALLGAVISLTVNCTLVEISLNPFFSVVRPSVLLPCLCLETHV